MNTPLRFHIFFHAIFASVYILLISYTIKHSYGKQWIPGGNMFSYFCFQYLKIIFTFIYSFNQRFKICKNNNGVLSDFRCILKSDILVSSKAIITPQESLFLNFLWYSSWKQFKQRKSPSWFHITYVMWMTCFS